jgi:hypothetical protein
LTFWLSKHAFQADYKYKGLRVHKIPPVVLETVRNAPPQHFNEGEQLFMSIPGDLRAALLPYQIEGVLFGLKQGGRAILGDEMVMQLPPAISPTHHSQRSCHFSFVIWF